MDGVSRTDQGGGRRSCAMAGTFRNTSELPQMMFSAEPADTARRGTDDRARLDKRFRKPSTGPAGLLRSPRVAVDCFAGNSLDRIEPHLASWNGRGHWRRCASVSRFIDMPPGGYLRSTPVRMKQQTPIAAPHQSKPIAHETDRCGRGGRGSPVPFGHLIGTEENADFAVWRDPAAHRGRAGKE
jgi:hypothetical protein